MGIVARSCLLPLPLALCAACSTVEVDHDRFKAPAIVPFEDAKFVAVSPGRVNSPAIAVLRGNPRTGPSAMFIRLKKGVIPMHIHVSDYQLVVMQGSLKRWSEQQTEDDVKPLGPGSYLFEPANQPHANSCLTDECLVYLVWGGKQGAQNVELRKQ
jgi:quercetin dioxygenase-like cupin family protein